MPKHLAIALLASLALAACSASDEAPEAHASANTGGSSSGLPEGHAAAGETLAGTKQAATGQACVDCHGAAGNAPIDPSYPKLGGQSEVYLVNALTEYQQGKRKHPTMQAQAESFSDQDVADIAAYLSSLK